MQFANDGKIYWIWMILSRQIIFSPNWSVLNRSESKNILDLMVE